MNLVFIVSSPTGVGKTTICNMETQRNKSIGRVVTHTTRKARKNEKHGRDYYFVTKEEFEKGLKRGEFVEYAVVHGNYYGTSKKALNEVLEKGKDALLAIDVQGAKNVMNQLDNVVSIFMLPPSFDDWLSRIKKDNVRNDVENRLKTALYEFGSALNFDFCIVNDEIEKTLNRLESIIESQHNKMSFVKPERMELIERLKKETIKYLKE